MDHKRMEENRIARFNFGVDKLDVIRCDSHDAVETGVFLVPGRDVVAEEAHAVGAGEEGEAAVFAGCGVDGGPDADGGADDGEVDEVLVEGVTGGRAGWTGRRE
jgi:hypothetical protein